MLRFLLALLTFSLLMTTGFAQAAGKKPTAQDLVFRNGDLLYLEGDNCEELLKQLNLMRNWRKKFGQSVSSDPITCAISPRNKSKKYVLLTGSVPSVIYSQSGEHAACDGPNCFNSALVAANVLSDFRYTTDEEFYHFLHSPLCKRIEPGQPTEAGDVIAIMNQGIPEHGFVHISDQLSFSKNGYLKKVAFQLTPPGSVYDTYQVDPKCRENGKQRPGCDRWVEYFRCKPLMPYLQEMLSKSQSRADESLILARLERNECRVGAWSRYSMGSMAFPKDDVKGDLSIMNALVEGELAKAMANSNPKEREEEMFFWNTLKFRVWSMQQQVKFITQP